MARVRPPVTDDLTQWCAAQGVDRLLLSPALTRERCAPTALEGPPHPNYGRHLVAQIAERFLVCLRDTRVRGPNGLVILPDGSFAAEAIYGRSHLELDRAYSTPIPPRVVRKDGDYFSLLGEFSNRGNYYHWVHDGLLRLHGVQAHLPAGVRYLVPSTLLEYQRETLRTLGVQDEQLVLFPGDAAWECERLWFASLPPSGADVPEAVAWLREQFWASAGVEYAEPLRRLYLSREGVAHARVVNEAELAPVLEKHGFALIQPERMSITDQVRLFAQAEVIVSATGSAQTNLLFAGQEARNLEILEPLWAEEKAYVVWTLAETIGQPYWYMLADTVGNQEHPERADLRVPATKLDRALGQLVGTGSRH